MGGERPGFNPLFAGLTLKVDQEMGGLPLRVIDPETGEDLQVRQDLE